MLKGYLETKQKTILGIDLGSITVQVSTPVFYLELEHLSMNNFPVMTLYVTLKGYLVCPYKPILVCKKLLNGFLLWKVLQWP